MRVLSALEERRLSQPARTDVAHVRELAADIVQALALEPPIDPALVASYRGISRIERAPLSCAACLMQVEGEFVVKVRASDSSRRQRFSAFHEVGHTLMPGYTLQPQFRCNPSARTSNRLEILCDQAAGELLIPSSFFTADVRKSAFSMTAVGHLGQRYLASEEATARKLVDAWPEAAAVARIEFCTSPVGPVDGEPTWRVRYFHKGSGRWPFVHQWAVVPLDSPLLGSVDGGTQEYEGDLFGLSINPIRGVQLSTSSRQFVNQQGEVIKSVTAIIRRPGLLPEHK